MYTYIYIKVECFRETKQIVYPKAGRVENDSYGSLFTVVLLLPLHATRQ